ncbi:hypothetical protein Asp14428_39070 [Actinoplanes sp. NBRC 14428]|nr:hypothetical protein Asp14428_39070 [Actinoplanes sp. NBRC 14428]
MPDGLGGHPVPGGRRVSGGPGGRRVPGGLRGPGGRGFPVGDLALQRAPLVRVRDARRPHRGSLGRAGLGLPRLLGAGPGLRDPRGQHELLAQRVALEARRQQQRLEAGVAVEADAEHLVRLALVPGRAGEEVDDRLHDRVVARHAGPDQQAVPAAGGPQVRHHGEAVGELVDRRQPVEEVAAQHARVAGRAERRPPEGCGHVDDRARMALAAAGHRGGEVGGVHGRVGRQQRDHPLTDLFGRHAAIL